MIERFVRKPRDEFSSTSWSLRHAAGMNGEWDKIFLLFYFTEGRETNVMFLNTREYPLPYPFQPKRKVSRES